MGEKGEIVLLEGVLYDGRSFSGERARRYQRRR